MLRGSHTRTHDTGIQESIPQLDGPVSVPSRTRRRLSENMRFEQGYLQEGIYLQGLLHHAGGNILVRVVMILIVIEEHMEIRRPPERGRYQGQNGRPPDRRSYQDRGYSRRGYPNQDGRPLGKRRTP